MIQSPIAQPMHSVFLRKHISITVNSNRKMKNDMEEPACLADLDDLLPTEVLSNFKGNIVFNIYKSGSQHVDKQFNFGNSLPSRKSELQIRNSQPPDCKFDGTENTVKEERALPEVLATDKAMVLWQKAQDAGYVDANYQPLISRTQAALLADAIAERLGIKEKWKVFEGLWNRKNMYHDYYRAMEQQQSLAFQDILKQLFSADIEENTDKT